MTEHTYAVGDEVIVNGVGRGTVVVIHRSLEGWDGEDEIRVHIPKSRQTITAFRYEMRPVTKATK
jgi:hypothetical protein